MKTTTSLEAEGKANGMSPLTKRIVGKTTTLAIGIAALVGVAGVGQANAATVTNSGCPGGFTAPRTVGTYLYGNVLIMDPFLLQRSPCFTGTQKVTVVYRAYEFGGRAWTYDWGLQGSVNLAPGMIQKNLHFNGAYQASSLVHVHAVIIWQTSTGQFIGQRIINYDHPRDYLCYYPQCMVKSSANPAVGAFIQF